MPNPITNFKNSFGTDLGNILITKEYLMTVYPQIVSQLITPELWTWGRGDNGQLGDNWPTDKFTPVTTFAGGPNWKQVAGGDLQTAAIKTDGTLWTWGRNDVGQLGDNTTTRRDTPVTTFAGGTNWKQVSGGYRQTAAIKTDGTLWTWGRNYYGQLGVNDANNRTTPVTTFAGGTNWKQVAVGTNFTAAIKTDGTLWTWGRADTGQLAENTGTAKSTPVTTFAGGTNWKQVSCGEFHAAAIKTDGTLWSWGRNFEGQMGDNAAWFFNRYTPVTTFAGGTNWKQVSCGRSYTAAIKTDGTLWAWGYNFYGQVGDNTQSQKCTPVTTFAGGTNWKQVACGREYTAAVKTDGTLWAWGINNKGQLGNNASPTKLVPVTTFAGGTYWKQVACGGYSTAAIKTSDNLQGI